MNYVNKFVLSVLASVACQISWGQSGVSQESIDAAAQRLRIDQQRQQLNAELDSQERACQDTFAVTSCMVEVKKRRIAMESTLKRQETILNGAERRERAAQQYQRMAEKQAERERVLAQGNASLKSDQAERKATLAEKQLQHQERGATPSLQRSHDKDAVGADAQSQSLAAAAAYQAKLENVRVKRLERDKRLKESKSGVASLPLPP